MTRSLSLILLASLFWALPAAAQATRTWVAAEGSDVNPCSPNAPCKTFTAALSKTAPGGEIDCLGPGGYGPVTITKSVTIDCTATLGGIIAAGVNGVVVNSGATSVVRLRGISVQGIGTGLAGVHVISVGSLSIENASFSNFAGFAIDDATGTPSSLVVSDTSVVGSSGGGIRVAPTAGNVVVMLNRVAVTSSSSGLQLNGTAGVVVATLRDSALTANATANIAVSSTGQAASLLVDGSTLIGGGTGIVASGATALVRVGRSTITGNATGVTALNNGTLLSYGNNLLNGNATDGTFTGSAIVQN